MVCYNKKIQKQIRILFILLSSFIIFVNSLANFKMTIRERDKLCLHDYYSDQTLITYVVNSDLADSLTIIVRDFENKKLIDRTLVQIFKDSFTTYGGGNYEICILNLLNQDVKIEIDIKSGIAAKDYSQIPKLKDLKPIEQDLQKLEDRSKDLYHLIMFADSHEKTYGSLHDNFIMGVSWVSIIIIIIMLMIGLAEAFIGRRIVLSKKLK